MSAFDSMRALKSAIRQGVADSQKGPPHVHHFYVDPTGTIGHCRCGASLHNGQITPSDTRARARGEGQ